ncbi:NYN domain-containing protein [Aeromicrobium camelliae]|uniref:NYN domain-containing protein n=1 Tax=Aeromicrobium camelliae TaxID=1538144 RepID=A0A3N6X5G4_9ACTN|nr:NYN domain-containing protein [Aeromicrobium camelliae]RQN09365.1 NYN domain-containing protein [Aeromicrobium camelliae]
MSDEVTYLLVDGENIDATLGQSIFGRRPQPQERPRWDRLIRFAEDHWGQPVKSLFFLAVNGELPMPFVQALTSLGYRPVPLSGGPDDKVVDIAIQRTLEAIAQRSDHVMLASNDGDFLPQIDTLVHGRRRVGVIGFDEFRNGGFAALKQRGLELIDLEYDVEAFNVELPRLRIIPIDEFDPLDFL